MATILDRFTINWQGEHEVKEAQAFRQAVGNRNINKTLKQLVREFMQRER